MKNYYVVTYVDGSTEMVANKKELAELIDYAYSYINLCFDQGWFVFLKRQDIYTIRKVYNGETIRTIKRKMRGDTL